MMKKSRPAQEGAGYGETGFSEMTSALISRSTHESDRSTAIAHLFVTYRSRLIKLAVTLGADADAEDIVAEAFYQLHKNWDDLRSPEAAAGYLRAVVRNLARMRLRRLVIARRYAEPRVCEPVVQSAEQQALLNNDQRAVVKALRRLPRRQFEALILKHWMNLKESEIAETMGISVGAVKSHTSRGITRLSEMLETRVA
ncbi:SigE family RNA polymerase sigma factor [Streptomyces venetus]|uniref:SigE family RNA polymerase sigma factor n=1 Tax=Streptomyces venetus TaxID=1701086 RepID=A0ABP8GCM8_9ACTN